MTKADKLDLYKQHKAEYVTPKRPVLVDVGRVLYLAIQGRGEPGSEEFASKMQAMYSVAFTIKMTKKFAGRDYKVCHLEGLWWGKRKGDDFFKLPRDQWNWKLLIRVPEFITEEDVKGALGPLAPEDGKSDAPEVKLERLTEGRCVQVLHVGPYTEEGKTIAAMLAFAKEKGLTPHGRHHEIYISDPNTVTPDKLRTILRQPVR